MGGETKFEKFKNFLVSRKAVLDNVELMGRRSEGSTCEFCGKSGHTEDKCFAKRRQKDGKKPKGKSGCAICGDLDHWKNECPERGSNKDKKTGN